ncbi:MAG: hypothetical protein V1899_12795 [Planctomycetota bacterium]
MKKLEYLDKYEIELAKSLENEKWISDFTKKEKNNTKNMPAIICVNENGSISE